MELKQLVAYDKEMSVYGIAMAVFDWVCFLTTRTKPNSVRCNKRLVLRFGGPVVCGVLILPTVQSIFI